MSTYSRKHYCQVAEILCNNNSDEVAVQDTLLDLRDDFIDIFENDNEQFDTGRFIAACDLNDDRELANA